MRLLCDAIAFCYGPATVLKRILEHWRQVCGDITLVGNATTLEYMTRTNLVDRFIEVDTEDLEQIQLVVKGEWDVLLSVCNPVGFSALKHYVMFTVYWDFLLWMRSSGDAPEFQADRYVVEMYPGCEKAIRKWGNEIPGLVLCPVLADWQEASTNLKSEFIIVGLGGQRSKLTQPGVNTIYPELMVDLLQNATMTCQYPGRFLVTTDNQTVLQLSKVYKNHQWDFQSLPHEIFLSELDKAKCFITHPGLYSPFESLGRAVPTFFLPSSNYTQILQLKSFRKIGFAPKSIDWNDILGNDVPNYLPEPEGIRQVLKLVNSGNQSFVRKQLVEEFISWLSTDKSELDTMINNQRDAMSPYYGDFNKILLDIIVDAEARINVT